ncbi:hypothetical protein [Phyllobacterium sp. YR531]|uniref:hypothetical protein n=1 Tax=Phyllobacterium sp. YR531 TaxID=1144343 RepID=UPI00026F49EE|nr:hypothetical protein [Phyllobacterium sp. YR531]EJM99954.1 hypothetical protein PMI41_03848 [Phyllobacterium sp. YR531]
MQFFLSALAMTTVLGSVLGAIQTGARIWQGGAVALFGLSAIGIFRMSMSIVYPALSADPILATVVFLIAVEFAASHAVLNRQQTAGVAGGALMLTTISSVFLAAGS